MCYGLDPSQARVNDDVKKANLLNRVFAAKFTDPDVHFIPDVLFATDIVSETSMYLKT